MPKVSVITPSIRPEGLEILNDALEEQTYEDFEWLICSPEDPGFEMARWIPDKFTEGYWSLNRAYNSLFKHSKGDIIVTLQDWIWIPSDGIEKFVNLVKETGYVVSGVGDQYERIDKMGKPQVKTWSDPRKHTNHELGSFYEVYPNDAEWNWCAFPKKLIYEIGGMDEELDFLGYGGDQLQAVERMDAVGARFFLDQTNESFTIRHDRSDFGGQEEWDKNHVILNGKYDARKNELLQSGQWPRLNYLK